MERVNQRIFDENAAGKAWESITLSNNFVFFKVMQVVQVSAGLVCDHHLLL